MKFTIFRSFQFSKAVARVSGLVTQGSKVTKGAIIW